MGPLKVDFYLGEDSKPHAVMFVVVYTVMFVVEHHTVNFFVEQTAHQ